MSWGTAVAGAFKNGLKQDMSAQGARSMRDQNDPSGQGYGGGRAPAPPPAPVPQQAIPAADPMTVGAPPAAAAPAQQDSPLIALLHAIWQRPGTAQGPVR